MEPDQERNVAEFASFVDLKLHLAELEETHLLVLCKKNLKDIDQSES